MQKVDDLRSKTNEHVFTTFNVCWNLYQQYRDKIKKHEKTFLTFSNHIQIICKTEHFD